MSQPGGGDQAPAPAFDAALALATAARARAYAPYSGYAVGAAVVSETGQLFAGCNVENASYGATLCAERVAVGAAITGGARRLTAVVVVTANGAPPCGCCRQVLAELAGPDLPVLLATADGPLRTLTLGALLPEAFAL